MEINYRIPRNRKDINYDPAWGVGYYVEDPGGRVVLQSNTPHSLECAFAALRILNREKKKKEERRKKKN